MMNWKREFRSGQELTKEKRVSNNEPAAIPESGPIPFAPVPTGVCFWPVRTSDSSKRVVSFLGADGGIVGSKDRRFLAMREDGARYHVGVDLYGIPGDAVVACRDGKVANFYNFYKNSYALLINHGDVVVNYSEVAADSLKNNGLRVGLEVKAGQRIGTVAQLDVNGMCHFETYTTGTAVNAPWLVKKERPPNLLNPTRLLLYLAESGIGIDAAAAAAKNRVLGQSLEWQTKLREIGHALRMSAAPYGADDPALALAVAKWQCAHGLGEDGVIGPHTWGSLGPAV
jgi:murein DD-endopeptidase MepM/ murein hydrolase activator NlpD